MALAIPAYVHGALDIANDLASASYVLLAVGAVAAAVSPDRRDTLTKHRQAGDSRSSPKPATLLHRIALTVGRRRGRA